jgi:sulfite oxidase
MSGPFPRRFFAELGRLTRPTIRPRTCWRTFTGAAQSTRSTKPPALRKVTVPLVAGGSLLVTAYGISQLTNRTTIGPPEDKAKGKNSCENTDDRDPSLPRFRLAEIKKHDAKSGSPWVTQGDKVYDITDWIEAHPGGDVILRAAGGSIDPYWDIFKIHKSPHVYEILQQYLIGLIHSGDLVDGESPKEEIEDPFIDDPKRDSRLLVLTEKPRNAETPKEGLVDSFLTPNELFYVRNHMWVPTVEGDGRQHTLKVELYDGTEKTYTLDELRSKFKSYRITATLQCSGNRRKHMTTDAAPTNGLQWNVGGISCAEWEGVRLSDVLADAGVSLSAALDGTAEAKHVLFSGLEAYGASIPLDTAVDPRGDVLLAYAMNGKPLPRDHGFPLRALVPGHVAARSVKWLSRISLSDEESPSQWQRRDYKCFGPNEGPNPDWDRAPAIQEMPVTSAIATIKLGDRVAGSAGTKDDPKARRPSTGANSPLRREAVVRGYAYAGGGREIRRVDVSLDGGKTWDQAELLDDWVKANGEGTAAKHCKGHKAWAWKRWVYEGVIPLTASDGGDGQETVCSTVLVKATDDAYNSQPESQKGIYNVRGNLATAWHRVRVCSKCSDEAQKR